jgi:hypothetical protein
MKLFNILLIIFLLTSCVSTKEVRQQKRASNKIEKLNQKSKRIAAENGLIVQDTIQSIVQYVTPYVKADTVFSIDLDTVIVEKENLTIRYIRRDNNIYLEAECDSIFITDTLTTYIDRISKPIFVKEPLSKMEKIWMSSGKGLMWLIIVALAALIIRFVIKKYIPFV